MTPRRVHELPGDPPDGEHVLWQGAPDFAALLRSMHAPLLTGYFAVLLAWYAGDAFTHSAAHAALLGTLRIAALVCVALGVITSYAWLTARFTSYTLTNKRVVLQIGIALPISLNIPFAVVTGAAVKAARSGAGDLVLTLAANGRLSYPILWPHARPWRLAPSEPMLRAIPDVARVATLLARNLEDTVSLVGEQDRPMMTEAAPARAPMTVAA